MTYKIPQEVALAFAIKLPKSFGARFAVGDISRPLRRCSGDFLRDRHAEACHAVDHQVGELAQEI